MILIKHNFNGLVFKAGDHLDLVEKISLVYASSDLRKKLSDNARMLDEEYDCVHKNKIIFANLRKIVPV